MMSEKTDNQSKQTLDQRRANHAWEATKRVLEEYPPKTVNGKRIPHVQAKKFGGQAKKLPMRIMSAGLGQALAFLDAKDYAPDLLVTISDWVLDKRGKSNDKSGPPLAKQKPEFKKTLIQSIIKGDSDFLRRVTDEVQAYLVWLNRFAEAEGLKDEGDES